MQRKIKLQTSIPLRTSQKLNETDEIGDQRIKFSEIVITNEKRSAKVYRENNLLGRKK